MQTIDRVNDGLIRRNFFRGKSLWRFIESAFRFFNFHFARPIFFILTTMNSQICCVDSMGTWSGRTRPHQRFSSILLLLFTALGEYVCVVWEKRWNTNCDCGALLAFLYFCDTAIDISGVWGRRVLCHNFRRFSIGEWLGWWFLASRVSYGLNVIYYLPVIRMP